MPVLMPARFCLQRGQVGNCHDRHIRDHEPGCQVSFRAASSACCVAVAGRPVAAPVWPAFLFTCCAGVNLGAAGATVVQPCVVQAISGCVVPIYQPSLVPSMQSPKHTYMPTIAAVIYAILPVRHYRYHKLTPVSPAYSPPSLFH